MAAPLTSENTPLLNSPQSKSQSWFNEALFFDLHVLFSQIRLFTVRLLRILSIVLKFTIPAFVGLFGLSNGISFAVDLALVLNKTFFGTELTAWQRFKKAMQEGNRIYRMMNDSVWFIINLTVFLTTGPLFLIINPILNLVGFSFDVAHETFWLGKKTHDLHQKAQDFKNNNNIDEYNKTIAERNNEFKQRLWTVVFTALLLAGMAMIYFPPTALPGAILIGSAIALGAGSIFTGIGRRIFRTISSCFTQTQTPDQKDSPPIPLTNSKLNRRLGYSVNDDALEVTSATPPIETVTPSPRSSTPPEPIIESDQDGLEARRMAYK